MIILLGASDNLELKTSKSKKKEEHQNEGASSNLELKTSKSKKKEEHQNEGASSDDTSNGKCQKVSYIVSYLFVVSQIDECLKYYKAVWNKFCLFFVILGFGWKV